MKRLTYEKFIKWAYKNAYLLSESDMNVVIMAINRINPLGPFERLKAWSQFRYLAEAIIEEHESPYFRLLPPPKRKE